MEILSQQNTITVQTESRPLEGGVYTVRENSIYDTVKLKLEDIINSLISQDDTSVEDEINAKFLELDFASEYNIDSSLIGTADAIFFINLLNQNNIISYSVDNNNKIVLDVEGKRIDATNSLLDVLKSSIEKNKPVRLDFDKDVTVILKLDREGKIQAHFIPGSSEVEKYLKNNIPSLKQNFEEQGINYSYLGYSQQNKNNKKRKGQ